MSFLNEDCYSAKGEQEKAEIVEQAANTLALLPNSRRFNISPLMFTVGRWSAEHSPDFGHAADTSSKIAQSLVEKGKRPEEQDLFSRNAYHYIAEGVTGSATPGRGWLLEMLSENDDKAIEHLNQPDHLGISPWEMMYGRSESIEFDIPDSLKANAASALPK